MAQFMDLATDAFQKIGVYAPGEPISDADAERALNTANDMLDSWSNESLTCFAILEQSGVMQPGISAYTIGAGGVFNMTRPLKLISGPGAAYLLDTNSNRYGVEVVPQDKWNMIGNTAVDSNVPIYLFFDPQYPLGIINVWPTPNIGWTLYWDSYLQLVDFGNISGTLSLPSGYKKAIQDCLAVELWPYYFKGEAPQLIIELASKSKGNIKRTNIRENVAVYDPELVSRSNSTYNIYTDGR